MLEPDRQDVVVVEVPAIAIGDIRSRVRPIPLIVHIGIPHLLTRSYTPRPRLARSTHTLLIALKLLILHT